MNTKTIAYRDVVVLNKTLKNTYLLLSGTILFSAFTAIIAMALRLPPVNIFLLLGVHFGLLIAIHRFSTSGVGLLLTFAWTGFLGLTLGPIISYYLTALSNGPQLVALSLGLTGVIFLSLSYYAVVSKKDFSFMGSFLFAGILVAFLGGLASVFWSIPLLSLAVSCMFVLLMCGLILYETSAIVGGGQTNYILATIALYMSIYNLFLSLLHLLGVFGGD